MLIKSEHNGHILEHDEESHLYVLDNKPLCGVTSILSAGYPKSQRIYDWQTKEGVKWAIKAIGDMSPEDLTEEHIASIVKESPTAFQKALDNACDIGHWVHQFAYETEACKPIVRPEGLNETDLLIYNKCCDQFVTWHEQNDDEIIGLEELVCSIKHEYAGRFDRLADRKGIIVLTDYKTSSNFYITQFVQMAAYCMAIEEWQGIVVEDIEIVRFDKKTGSLSTRNLSQLANTVGIKPTTCLKRLKQQFVTCLDTYHFKNKFDKYIRK
jgi:hypothetical protein